jgi:hypothetical protein
VTYKQIISHVSRMVGMQLDTSAPEGDLIRDWVHAGIIDIAARTRAGVRAIDLVIAPHTAVHDMSQQIISLLDIEDPGYGFLKRYSREDAAFMQTVGQRGYAYEEPLLWLSPIRSEDYQTVRAYGVFMPRLMENDDDSPSDPEFGNLSEQFHPTIVTYCLWKGGEYIEHEQSGGGERWRVQYEGEKGEGGEISKIKAILSKRVSPAGSRRRDPLGQTGGVGDVLEYLGG